MTTVIRWKCCANPSIDTSRSKPEIGKTSPKVNKKFTQINCLCSIHSQICPRGRHPPRFPAAGAGMVVLIVANSPGLARIWSRHLERLGNDLGCRPQSDGRGELQADTQYRCDCA
jgi:hypothetical protein